MTAITYRKLRSVVWLANAALFFYLTTTNAYQLGAMLKPHTSTSLNAWTLPKPASKNPFGTFTWYDDHNPTARKVVYHDE
jgi:hypothetical protein